MASDIPPTLTRYFAAQNTHDVEAMLETFAPDAEVQDEGQAHVALEAIRAWMLATSAKYAVTARPLRADRDGQSLRAIVQVSGNFPGSPADLTYDFLLDGGELIRRLEIR